MRSLRTAALAIVALTLVACSSATPGWTYAPAPSITPPPSAEPGASADTSAAPSEPSGSAQPSVPAPSGASTATTIDIAALNIAFDQTELAAPAGQSFQIVFANDDAGIPHNVEIKDAAGMSVFKGDLFNGVETRTYDVPALTAGAYPFLCTVHPNMAGTLTVG